MVIKNINADGHGGAPLGHTTRTIVFDSRGRLYVSVGSSQNVDQDSNRARIRRFAIPAAVPAGGIDFNRGVVFADGLRNEVRPGYLLLLRLALLRHALCPCAPPLPNAAPLPHAACLSRHTRTAVVGGRSAGRDGLQRHGDSLWR